MCSGVMYADPDLNVLWSLALRGLNHAALLRFFAHWTPVSPRAGILSS